MSITILELINNPHLKTEIIAGQEGLNNEITWAHSCELSDPTNWLVGGELVMTNGFAIPSNSTEQVNYIKNLIRSNVSGLAIGKQLHSPKLSQEMLNYADKHGFPILLTNYEIPWIALSKTVALTNASENYSKVTTVMKLYDLIRKSINNESTEKLIELIGLIINCKIEVIDSNNKKTLYSTVDSSSSNLEDFQDEGSYLTKVQIQVPASRPVTLIVVPNNNDKLDNLILNHLATIIGLIIEKDTTFYERKRRLGAEIMTGLIEEQYSQETIVKLLSQHNLNNKELFLLACSIEQREYDSSWLHIKLYEYQIPHFLTYKENTLLILLPAENDLLTYTINEFPKNVKFGISKGNKVGINMKRMCKEALWALRSAEALGKKQLFYNENLSISPFLPNDRKEVTELIQDIIGPLLEYDLENKSQLIKTLYVFLAENQSWKRSAEILFIHKQTLVYRIKRIEKILNKKLDNMNRIAEIWIALQTAISLDLIPHYLIE